jgi:hypothetical protein
MLTWLSYARSHAAPTPPRRFKPLSVRVGTQMSCTIPSTSGRVEDQRELKHSTHDETHFGWREPFRWSLGPRGSISRRRDLRTVGDYWSRRSSAFAASGLDVMEFRVDIHRVMLSLYSRDLGLRRTATDCPRAYVSQGAASALTKTALSKPILVAQISITGRSMRLLR